MQELAFPVDKRKVEVFVARHAIFDKSLAVFGYELLFRSSNCNVSNVTDNSAATLQVLANTLLASGLDTIGSNKPLFINFGQELLVSEWTYLLPSAAVVLEILESVQPDPQVIAACINLQKEGYVLALDDVAGGAVYEKAALLDVADFVKVDFRATSRDEQQELAKSLRSKGKKLLAEKVENYDEFVRARDAGYDYFQGFFFAKPTLLSGHVPDVKLAALRMIKELQLPELDFERLKDVIRCNVSLTYKLFRYVNSALFGRRREIRTIREALVMLGETGVRRWITLATLPTLATGTPHELLVHALVRARFCELLAEAAEPDYRSDAFLAGLFSLLDALVDKPLLEILPELSLPERISNTLLGTEDDCTLAAIYRIALTYERGEWDSFEKLIAMLPAAKTNVADLYLQAIRWSREMLSLIGPEPQPKRQPDRALENFKKQPALAK